MILLTAHVNASGELIVHLNDEMTTCVFEGVVASVLALAVDRGADQQRILETSVRVGAATACAAPHVIFGGTDG